jgi:hypothetical protein
MFTAKWGWRLFLISGAADSLLEETDNAVRLTRNCEPLDTVYVDKRYLCQRFNYVITTRIQLVVNAYTCLQLL